MGKRVSIFDDIDDDLDADRTVTFALDGKAYEIDLAQVNIDKLHKVLEPFIEAGRTAGRAVPVKGGGKSRPNPELDAIRQWASKNGHRVSDKGRIPQDVVKAYEEARTEPAEPAKAPAKKAAAKTAEPAFSGA